MTDFFYFSEFFSRLGEAKYPVYIAAGIVILLANLCWLLIHLLYGEVLIYNLKEGECYTYLGCGWIEYRRGRYVLVIPRAMLKRSSTTRYKLKAGRFFATRHEGEPLCIRFGKEYETFVLVQEEMIAKNHVATSGKL